MRSHTIFISYFHSYFLSCFSCLFFFSWLKASIILEFFLTISGLNIEGFVWSNCRRHQNYFNHSIMRMKSIGKSINDTRRPLKPIACLAWWNELFSPETLFCEKLLTSALKWNLQLQLEIHICSKTSTFSKRLKVEQQ